MHRFIMIFAGLGLVACDPFPKDAGTVESTDGSGTGDDSGDTATGMASADGSGGTGQMPPVGSIDWTLDLGESQAVFEMVRSPNGVVMVLVSLNDPQVATVVEYSPNMELLWSVSLGEAWVYDLTPLDDGGYLLGGSAGPDGMGPPDEVGIATAWRVSCCGVLEDSQSFPGEPGFSAITIAEPHAGGIFMVRVDDDATTFIRSDLGFEQEWVVESPDFQVLDAALTPSGDVVLLANEGGDADLLYEVALDGSGSGVGPGERTELVGSGADLSLMTFGEEEVRIQPYDGGAVTAVSLPGTLLLDHASDRHDRFAFATAAFYATEMEENTVAQVAEFDGDGMVYRTIFAPPLSSGATAALALAVGEDHSIYISLHEFDNGQQNNFVQHIAPL